ncbi:MAG: hypothetical protein AAGE52_11220 [Myxococcota bacterium]
MARHRSIAFALLFGSMFLAQGTEAQDSGDIACELALAEAKLAGLSVRYGERHPDREAQRRYVDELRSRASRPPNRACVEAHLQDHERELARLRLLYGSRHPVLLAAERTVAVLRDRSARALANDGAPVAEEADPVACQLAVAEAELAGLSVRYGRNHPTIRQQALRVDELRARQAETQADPQACIEAHVIVRERALAELRTRYGAQHPTITAAERALAVFRAHRRQ